MFVHGWTCNHTHFAPQIEHFATDHRVVAVDLRGHGESDAPEQRYTVSALADDVAWLCDEANTAARACTVPVLHIGAEDLINDAAALRALNPWIGTGQTVGAGHSNQLEVPEQVNAMIGRFLAVALH